MSYCLTSNFLYESTIFTTIKFIIGDLFEVERDTNTRTLNITFKNGDTYSRLMNVTGFIVLNPDEKIKEEIFGLRNEILTIGNAKYFFKNGVSRFSQLFNTVIKTSVNDYGEMVFVSIFRDEKLSNEEYIKLLNNSGIIYCKIDNLEDFNIYNYHDVDVSRGKIDVSESSSVTDFSYLAVSATDTNSSFMKHCKNHYPDIEVLSEFSDLSNLENNENGYLLVKFGLPNWQGGEHTTHLFNEFNPLYPKYGKYMVSNTRGFIDYITNDWDKYLEMRYDFLLMRKLFTHNKFMVYPEKGENFQACVVFDSSIDDQIDRSPSDKSIESSKLYSLKIQFTIYSYIVENYLEFPAITKIITNIRSSLNNNLEYQFVSAEDKPTIVMEDPIETPPYEEYKGDVWPLWLRIF